MPSTTPYKRGDIVLVPFPFTDLTSSKRRPALVISPDSFNAQQQDLVVAAIASQVPDATETLVLTSRDFSSGTLVKSRDAAAERLHVLPDLLVFFAGFLVHVAHAGELQVGLQVAERGGDVVQVVGEEPAVAQLAEG